jgi:hypothetical protein
VRVRVVDEVAYIAPEVVRKVLAVGRSDDRPSRVAAEKKGWEDLRRKQALSVPRRHEHHQALDLATLDGLELRDQLRMVPGHIEMRIDKRRVSAEAPASQGENFVVVCAPFTGLCHRSPILEVHGALCTTGRSVLLLPERCGRGSLFSIPSA